MVTDFFVFCFAKMVSYTSKERVKYPEESLRKKYSLKSNDNRLFQEVRWPMRS